MAQIDRDGGPAFPTNTSTPGETGMWLREYFAGQALAGLTSDIMGNNIIPVDKRGAQTLAKNAFEIADAMMDIVIERES